MRNGFPSMQVFYRYYNVLQFAIPMDLVVLLCYPLAVVKIPSFLLFYGKYLQTFRFFKIQCSSSYNQLNRFFFQLGLTIGFAYLLEVINIDHK